MSQITGISSISNIRLLFTGTDVNPDALDWTNIVGTGTLVGTSNTQTFTGINTPINIFFTVRTPTNLANTNFYYSKNGGVYTNLNQSTNISVSNNDTISWQVQNVSLSGTGSISGTITVSNASNQNTDLDTFTYSVDSSSTPPGGPV